MIEQRPTGPAANDIKNLFSSIAHGYDRANDLMTFGMARQWRRKLVRLSGAKSGDRVLDCATGTGDLAIDFKRVVGPSGQVIGTDFCAEMLKPAPAKAKRLGLEIEFAQADAMNLPYPNASFDIASIAYGIRNVSNAQQALSEMARVVKPGGRVMILETGDTQWPIIKTAMQFYFQKVVPRIGGWVTGQPQAYEYLSTSSLQFPSGERFLELMRSTEKFQSVDCQVIMGGASFIYRGIVK